jgi:hypothetical protein
MAYSIANNQLLRKHFQEIKRIIDIPNLIDIQKNSVSCRRICLLPHVKTLGSRRFSALYSRFGTSAKPVRLSMLNTHWGPRNMTLRNAISGG